MNGGHFFPRAYQQAESLHRNQPPNGHSPRTFQGSNPLRPPYARIGDDMHSPPALPVFFPVLPGENDGSVIGSPAEAEFIEVGKSSHYARTDSPLKPRIVLPVRSGVVEFAHGFPRLVARQARYHEFSDCPTETTISGRSSSSAFRRAFACLLRRTRMPFSTYRNPFQSSS